MLLYVIRHGDPTYSPDALTPLGHRQAEAVEKRLAAQRPRGPVLPRRLLDGLVPLPPLHPTAHFLGRLLIHPHWRDNLPVQQHGGRLDSPNRPRHERHLAPARRTPAHQILQSFLLLRLLQNSCGASPQEFAPLCSCAFCIILNNQIFCSERRKDRLGKRE